MNRFVFSLLAPLSREGFSRLRSAVAALNVREISAVFAAEGISVREEDVLQLIFALERFALSDSDIVRMTVYERRNGSAAVPVERESSLSFVSEVRSTVLCLQNHLQKVKELRLPESDLALPEFRFLVLKAAMEEIPVKITEASRGGLTVFLAIPQAELSDSAPHAVLVRVLDPGNIGAIVRSAVAFGIRDLALIGSGADGRDPSVLSVSRCAALEARICCFDSIFDYRERFPEHAIYPLMLQSSVSLEEAVSRGVPERYSLVLGNESRGLPDEFAQLGTPVRIPIESVNSLNVSAAAAVSFYAFTAARKPEKSI